MRQMMRQPSARVFRRQRFEGQMAADGRNVRPSRYGGMSDGNGGESPAGPSKKPKKKRKRKAGADKCGKLQFVDLFETYCRTTS
jgi:hypothetical protein